MLLYVFVHYNKDYTEGFSRDGVNTVNGRGGQQQQQRLRFRFLDVAARVLHLINKESLYQQVSRFV